MNCWSSGRGWSRRSNLQDLHINRISKHSLGGGVASTEDIHGKTEGF
ncbi:mCG1040378 [Mus musculus]|nr:mCG1040378 [Mus musculus]